MPPRSDSTRILAAGGGLLFLLTLLAYLPALRGGPVWDDFDWIVENELLRSVEGLRRAWLEPSAFHQYYPLTMSSFWLERQLWGDQTVGYHLVNAVLHATSAFLLWRVLRGLELGFAFAAAAVFALHPVAVESVAWITERKNVLSLVLALASLLLWLPYIREPDARPTSEGRWRTAAASALFLLALLAKTAVCVLPAAILLLRWWKHGRLRRVDFLPLAPWFLAALGLGAGTAWLEEHTVGAQGAQWALTPVERVLVAGRALWFYAGKVLVPRELSFIYPRWEVSSASAWQFLPPAAALATLVLLFALRGRIGRGPFAVAAAYAGVLSPTLGFFDVYAMRFSYVADHWNYHAMSVLIGALAHGGSRILAQAPTVLRLGVPAAVAIGLGALTRSHAALYVDQETLYRDTLTKNPACAMVHANLGVVLMGRGARDEGLAHLSEAFRLDPADDVVAKDLGQALELQQRDAEAAAHYQRLLARSPSDGVVLNALAGLLSRSQDPSVRDPARAVVLAERAGELASPVPSELWATLAQAYTAAGRPAEARSSAKRGLETAQAEGNERMVSFFERRLRVAPPTGR